MLLATASYALPCHASNGSSGNSNSKTQKRTTHNPTSQKGSTAVVATTTAALMKTIAVRANRNGGYSKDDASVQKTQTQQTTTTQHHSKTNNNAHVNDVNLKKASNATTGINSTNSYNNNSSSSKNATKHTTVNVKSAASTTTASSSSATSNSTPAPLKATIPTASFLKTYTVPPTTLHRSSKDRLRSCSIDSLHDEMCHFKPIRSLPLTPLKSGTHSRGFSLKAPKPSLCTSSRNCDFSAIKRIFDRENQRGKLKLTRKNETRLSSSSIFQNMKPHLSAFVRLQPNASIDLQQISASYTSSTPPTAAMKSQKAHTKPKIQKTTKSRKFNAANNKTIAPNAPTQQRGKKHIATATNIVAAAASTIAATTTKVATKNSTNPRKRKAQTNIKQNELIETKKSRKVAADKTKRNANMMRKSPPLTRGRRRQLLGNDAQLIGPLV